MIFGKATVHLLHYDTPKIDRIGKLGKIASNYSLLVMRNSSLQAAEHRLQMTARLIEL
jgi:hypothetical protein